MMRNRNLRKGQLRILIVTAYPAQSRVNLYCPLGRIAYRPSVIGLSE
jgi:hypothetical protein